ncbi:MAG: hypothetical protein AB1560_02685 [Pseudomonadota bacterium]
MACCSLFKYRRHAGESRHPVNYLDSGVRRNDNILPQRASETATQLAEELQALKKPRMRPERDTLALAAFVSRPQAEAQIGANRGKSYTTGFVMSTRLASIYFFP